MDFVRNVFPSEGPGWGPGEDKAPPKKSGGVMGTAAIFKNDFSAGPMVLVSKESGRWSLPTEIIPAGQKTKDRIVAFMGDRFGLDCGELKFVKKKGLTRSQRPSGTVGGAEFVFGAVLNNAPHDPERKDCKWVAINKIPRLAFGHASIARAAADKLLGTVSEGTMINQKLQRAYEALDRWFSAGGIEYDIVADEDDLQGYLVPKKYQSLTPRIMRMLETVSANNDLHCQSHTSRAGLVIALSLQAIAEATISAMSPDQPDSRYQRRLDLVFGTKSILESPFHTPTSALKRQRQSPTRNAGRSNLSEDLKGIAAHHQPVDILKRVERAMVDLGLVDALKAAGITNRLSKDKQVLRFFITDAEGRGREIAAYDLVKLGEPNDFEKALKDLRDLAHNRSPGTSEREMNRIRDQEAAVKDTAKKYTPQPEQEEKPTKPIVAGAPMGEGRDRMGDLIEQLLFQ